MVEQNTQLLEKVQKEVDWDKAVIFTDKEKVILQKGCTLLNDELR